MEQPYVCREIKMTEEDLLHIAAHDAFGPLSLGTDCTGANAYWHCLCELRGALARRIGSDIWDLQNVFGSEHLANSEIPHGFSCK